MRIFLLFLFVLVSAKAYSFINVGSDGCRFSSIDDKTCKVTGVSNKNAEEIIIPESIEFDGAVYSVVEVYSFTNGTNIHKVVLPKSVKTINSFAFRMVGTSKLASINLDYVENIGSCAFEFCDNLSETGSMMSLKTLEVDAFHGTAIKSVELPGSLKVVNNAFKNCKQLRKVILHEGIEKISGGFGGLVEKLSIPGSVTSLSMNLNATDALTEIRFEDGAEKLEIISLGSFNTRIENFKSLYLGRNLTADREAFNAFRNATSVEIGKNVTELPSGIFGGFSKLPYIKIEKDIKEIPDGAFSGCVSLKKIDFAGEIEKIGVQSFYGAGLEEIIIPGSVVEIGEMAFSNCSNATMIDLGDGLNVIGRKAFSKCNSVVELTIPGNIENVGFGAFQYMRELKSLVIEPGASSLEFITESDDDYDYGYNKYLPLFEGSHLKTVEVDRNFTTTYSKAGIIKSCNYIETITVGDNVTELPEYGLAVGYDYLGYGENANLRTVHLGKNLRRLGYNAIHFNILPDGVTKGRIYSYNPEPPEWTADVINGIVRDTFFSSEVKLYVPDNSLEKYSEAPVWKQFAPFSIFGFNTADINDIKADDACKAIYYDLKGTYIGHDRSSLSPGIYIEHASGKSRKITVK